MAASVEEESYELGGATGVTIFGSLMTAIYTAFMVIPAGSGFPDTIRDSPDKALLLAETLPADQAQQLREIGFIAFDQAFMWVIATAVFLLFATALLIFRMNRKPCEAALRKAKKPAHSGRMSRFFCFRQG